MPQELPKLSGITQALATPEKQFEAMILKATGVELPPGPQSVLFKVQQGFEVGNPPKAEQFLPPAPKLEKILAKLPPLPKLEEVLPRVEKPYELAKEAPKAGYVMSR
jgi:hypothetical protein